MGTPKVTILLDERGEMSAVEVKRAGVLVGPQDRET